jgi:uncharacterized protein YecE (DUF72 family)
VHRKAWRKRARRLDGQRILGWCLSQQRAAEDMTARIFIGTSGWSYPHWRGRFYPRSVPHARELQYASARFDSLEVNRSFYSLLTPAACSAWQAATPDGFVFALKGSRFITHAKKLRDVEVALANFFASGVLALGDKLGPIVWQLSEQLRFDEARLDAFFALLPRTGAQAAALARGHDQRVRHGAVVTARARLRLRHAIEPRHASFFTPAFARVARRHGVAIVVTDSPDWPYVEEPTAGFMYLRLHGSRRKYASRYTDAELDRWAARIRAWHAGGEPDDARRIGPGTGQRRGGRDVYVYFDNDHNAYAARDALRLHARVTGTAGARRRPRDPGG